MGNRLKVEKNALWLLAAEVLARAFNFALLLAIWRILGREDFGVLAFDYAVADLVLVGTGFGFDDLLVRETARKPGRAGTYLLHVLALRSLALPFAGLACAAASALQGEDPFLGGLVFLSSFALQQLLLFCALFRARQAMAGETLARFFAGLGIFAGGLGVLLAGGGLAGVVGARLGVVLLVTIGVFLWIRRVFRLSFGGFRRRFAKALVRAAFPLAGFLALTQVYGGVQAVLLGYMEGNAAVADYGAAQKIFLLMLMVPASLSRSYLPALSLQRGKGLGGRLLRGGGLLFGLSLVFLALTWAFGGTALSLLFRRDWAGALPVLQVLSLALVPDFLNHLFAAGLVASDRQGQVLKAAGGGAGAALLSAPFLVHWGGAVGAAWSLVGAVTVVLAFQAWFLLAGAGGRRKGAA